jgi:FkbM family methyltransferase
MSSNPADPRSGRRATLLGAWRYLLPCAALWMFACDSPAPSAAPASSPVPPPAAAPSAEVDFEALLRDGKSLYSQGKEELVVRHFFRDRRDGFFLDVGCFRWKDLSTTYYLESELGWKGISIDALDRFRAGYERNRPNTRFRNFVVGDVDGGKATFYESVSGRGVSSTKKSWIHGFFAAAFPEVEPEVREIRVPRTTLNALLAREGVESIDFMSMDIEGSEPEGLAGFDIDRYRPKLVAIEMAAPGVRAIHQYFGAHDYEMLPEYLEYDGINRYFRPKRGQGEPAGSD